MMQYDDVITNSRWWTDAIFKIVFWLYLGAILADQCEIWIRDEESHADIGYMTKTDSFHNFKTANSHYFENSSSPYLSCELSDFDQIWYTDAYFNFEDEYLTKNRNFANSRWRTDAILKIVFGYRPISAP